jgi:hypothetical protein
MNASKINKSNSITYERIAAIPLSRRERVETIEALHVGEQITEALLEIARVLRLLVTTPHLNPAFKPSFRH